MLSRILVVGIAGWRAELEGDAAGLLLRDSNTGVARVGKREKLLAGVLNPCSAFSSQITCLYQGGHRSGMLECISVCGPRGGQWSGEA